MGGSRGGRGSHRDVVQGACPHAIAGALAVDACLRPGIRGLGGPAQILQALGEGGQHPPALPVRVPGPPPAQHPAEQLEGGLAVRQEGLAPLERDLAPARGEPVQTQAESLQHEHRVLAPAHPHERLDELRLVTDDRGIDVSRRQLVAALQVAHRLRGPAPRQQVRALERAQVRQCAPVARGRGPAHQVLLRPFRLLVAAGLIEPPHLEEQVQVLTERHARAPPSRPGVDEVRYQVQVARPDLQVRAQQRDVRVPQEVLVQAALHELEHLARLRVVLRQRQHPRHHEGGEAREVQGAGASQTPGHRKRAVASAPVSVQHHPRRFLESEHVRRGSPARCFQSP